MRIPFALIRIHLLGLALLPATFLPAQDFGALSLPEIPDDTKGKGWTFTLAPRSFQKNPQLDFNVISEMTEEGRSRPVPTSAKPVYFVAQSGAFLSLGDGATPKYIPTAEKMEEMMKKALAANHFLPAPEGVRPDIVVVFSYGVHSISSEDPFAVLNQLNAEAEALAAEQEPPPAPISPPAGAEELIGRVLGDVALRRELVERAALIGGTAFSNELAVVLNDQVAHVRLNGGQSVNDRHSPFHRFLQRNSKITHLIEEAFSSCYFVVASAYDYDSLARNERLGLWRTRMTVNAQGVNMVETLPPLIASAAPFLGREMAEAAVMSRRIDRTGTVEIGEATVVGFEAGSGGEPKAETPPAPTGPRR